MRLETTLKIEVLTCQSPIEMIERNPLCLSNDKRITYQKWPYLKGKAPIKRARREPPFKALVSLNKNFTQYDVINKNLDVNLLEKNIKTKT